MQGRHQPPTLAPPPAVDPLRRVGAVTWIARDQALVLYGTAHDKLREAQDAIDEAQAQHGGAPVAAEELRGGCGCAHAKFASKRAFHSMPRPGAAET